jgi:DNA polymerase-3 subunit delta'
MWHGIYGHDEIVEQFRKTLAAGRLASTYLFVGPPGVGKKQFALALAQSLLCTESPDESLSPCDECESCRLFLAGSNPDLDVVGIRPDKAELIIGQFIGSDSNPKIPKEEALCHRLALKPYYGGRRVAIVDDADHFNVNSANCLLKTLEEPPPKSLLILIGTSPSRQLPTIRSRSQVVRFQALPVETVAQVLVETGLVEDETQARDAAELSEGSVERAARLLDLALGAFRGQLRKELSSQPNSVRLGRAVQAFVDEAGKEPAEKRERLRIVIGFAIEYYRGELRDCVVAEGHATASEGRSEALVGALESSVSALEYIDRNANLGLVIQQWSEELAGWAAEFGAKDRLPAVSRG